MNRRLSAGLIGAAAAVTVALMIIALFMLIPPAQTLSLSALLDRADGYIARSYRTEARTAVLRAAAAAVSAEDMLRVLKRHSYLARAEGDYRAFKEYAVTAFSRHPLKPELCRIAIWACLRDGDPAAASALPRTFSSIPEVQALEAELLFADRSKQNSTPSADHSKTYLSPEDERNPARFVTAGRELGDDRFFLDAALLQMARGKIDEARRIADTLLLRAAYDEPSGLIAYEAGDWTVAANRLAQAAERERRPDLFIIAADARLMAADASGAAQLYERSLRLDPAFSAVPYTGLAWLLEQGLSADRTRNLRERAAALFPNDRTATAEYAKLLFRNGEREESRRIMDEWLKNNPDDFALRLLKLRLESDSLSADRYLIRLREVYFADPQNERAAAALVAELLDNRDAPGALAIITHFREASGPASRAWASAAAGIAEAALGNDGQATALLGEAIRLEDRWEYRYNRSVVLMAVDQLPEAKTDLERALELLGSWPDARAARAATHARLAGLYRRADNRGRALAEAQKALALDARNAEAQRILNIAPPGERVP
jgi:tetratricopeptide (TPR) repeat protein